MQDNKIHKVVFSEGIKMELNIFSWEKFKKTGDIDAYLLYKSVSELLGKEDKDNEWHSLEQEVLS